MLHDKYYEIYREAHPEWSDEQIWTAVSLDMEVDKVRDNYGEDFDVEDESIMRSIIEGARDWLHVTMPGIYEKMKNVLDRILVDIGTFIRKGIDWVLDKLDEYTK